MTIPNLLTLLRIALLPVLILVFYSDWEYSRPLSALVFCLAALTDLVDGYLARLWQQESQFGAFLDPVADKLTVAAALLLVAEAYASAWYTVPAIVIISREITVSALREWMAELGSRSKVAVSWLGKVKTVAQMGALVLLLWGEPFGWFPTEQVGFAALYLAAVLTIWSMLGYLRATFTSTDDA